MKYLSLILLVGMASAQHCRKIDIDKSTGFCTVPDPALTPGEMDPTLACVSNRDRPRSVTESEKTQSWRPMDTQQARRSLPASSIIGFRTGWEAPTVQRTSGSNRMRENS